MHDHIHAHIIDFGPTLDAISEEDTRFAAAIMAKCGVTDEEEQFRLLKELLVDDGDPRANNIVTIVLTAIGLIPAATPATDLDA